MIRVVASTLQESQRLVENRVYPVNNKQYIANTASKWQRLM